jgi:shikimate kinase
LPAVLGVIEMSARKIPNLEKSLVLVGMMGAGKSAIGQRLAGSLGIEFFDADEEIESAAGRSIPDIFEYYGEQFFREGERRVILRLLKGPIKVVATGGGAYMNDETRAEIKERAHSIWLRADIDTLWRRVSRRSNRPMLHTANPKKTLQDLIEKRYSVYGEADITVESTDGPHQQTVDRVINAVNEFLGNINDVQ